MKSGVLDDRRQEAIMAVKSKTHSGAKKRLVKLASGKVKMKQSGMRHLLSPHKSKGKRQAGATAYVHSANMNQTKRLLNF
jgi:ribosomal protein L35